MPKIPGLATMSQQIVSHSVVPSSNQAKLRGFATMGYPLFRPHLVQNSGLVYTSL